MEVTATVGGAFLSASIQVLFDQIASPDVLRGHKLSPALLRKLKISLLAVQAVLDDAEAKQFTSSTVRRWVDELKHAMYDAENVLDDITTDALRSTMESDPLNKVRTIISSLLGSFGTAIQSRAEEITDVLETLANQKAALGLNEGVGGRLRRRWPATSLVDEPGVYGRRDDKDEIVRPLLSNDASGSNVSVIALVGMGGIGKTTLANLVYKDESVEKCFDLKAWVCVSDEFDIVMITKTILKTLGVPIQDENDLNQLQLKLKDGLSGKKFLLVLDDVWNESFHNWDLLQTPFTVGLNGSRIIVTTRSIKVASVMRSVHIHRLEQLSFEDCWTLFAKHAFENGDPTPHPKLEEIGKEIVKKCQGLPLAAKTLGAALYSELQEKEWENILKSEIWDLPNDDILPALRLSYDHLPSQLKRCFAYCAIFPKDYEIRKESLILLWMAEGFLQPSEEGGKEMEDIGDAYFDELLSQSFFQKSSSTYASHFVMHELVNDLAQHVSKNFCLHSKEGKTLEFPKKLRHFSFFEIGNDLFWRFATLNTVNGLRTFLSLSKRSPYEDIWDEVPAKYSCSGSYFQLSNRVVKDLLPKAQYLQVFSLSGYDSIRDLPDAIGNLKHLRYLDLSHTSTRNLPDSICSLYNLQTLILSYCRELVELPKMMSKLIRLRHLDISCCYGVKKMPSQLGKLKGLRKLSDYIVGMESGSGVGELRELFHVSGSLHMKGLQNVVDGKDASDANLVGKQYLDDLGLVWNHEDSGVEQNGVDEAVLNHLQPHPKLKRLTIKGYGGSRFSDWLGGPEILINMVSLHLWECNNVIAFPPLGQLPSLEHLDIFGAEKVEKVGVEFYGADPSSTKSSFVSLKVLSFRFMLKWKEWVGGQGGEFPSLEGLRIQRCPELTGGLPGHLPLSTRLEISECERLVAPLPIAPSIRELNMARSGGVFLRNNATSSGFMCLESLATSNLSQWKELPPLLRVLRINTAVDSIESLLEEGILQSNNCLHDLAIEDCSISRTLGRACLPLTLKSLRLSEVKNVESLLTALFKCHFPFLELLDIVRGTCNSISCFPLSIFPSLTSLGIYYLEGLESLSFTISDEGVPPRYLKSLWIKWCPNLVSVEFPAFNFFDVTVSNCKSLKSLLHNNASFQSLSIEECPQLPIQGLPSVTHFHHFEGGRVDKRNKCLNAQFRRCWGSSCSE